MEPLQKRIMINFYKLQATSQTTSLVDYFSTGISTSIPKCTERIGNYVLVWKKFWLDTNIFPIESMSFNKGDHMEIF